MMLRSTGLAVAALLAFAAVPMPAAQIPSDAGAVRHALNRLTFGPRPGEVERVQREGLQAWIDRQLDPARIDDRDLERRLPAEPERREAAGSPQEMRRLARRGIDDLAAVRLTRVVYSERQLEEVLVDFWFNHFNVFAAKGRTAVFLASYERDAIRPHVLGKFRDLLGATARHPAMLFYLDNWLSASAESPLPRRRGLNENYARELMELHTLGVDGGYTQRDVVEVARAFTGWTLDGGMRARGQAGAGAGAGTGGFRFMPVLHERGAKTVLGTTINDDGVRDGERVLDLLAAHPSTARHIALKLARRFVADEPPAALVERAAARFQETGGNIREVVRVIVTSPELFAEDVRQAKVKTPLEFIASAYRAAGADVTDMRPAQQALQQLGMPLYLCQPPTGYDDTAETWTTAGALVARMNIAQRLGGAQAPIVGSPEFQRR